MKRILPILAVFSCFLIVSMSIIPSAQSSMVEEAIKSKIELEIEEIRNYSNNVIESLINLNLDIIKNILIIIPTLLILILALLLYIYLYIALFIGLMPLWADRFYYYLTEFFNLPEDLANTLSTLFGVIWGIAFSFFAPFVAIIFALWCIYAIP